MGIFFVGGSQRSGTTVFQELLCQDPATNPMVREVSYLHRLVEAYRFGEEEFDNDTCSYFDDLTSLRRFNAELVERFIDHVSRRFNPASHLILKHPELTPYFPDLHELLPEAHILLIVRDPRDIIASMIEVGSKLKQAGVEHIFQGRNMSQLCHYVYSFYLPALNCDRPEFRSRMTVIRYEDLTRTPEQVMANLRAFTGLPLEVNPAENPQGAAMAAVAVAPRLQAWQTTQSGKPLTDSSIGRYRQVLTRTEIRTIEKEMAEYLRGFGYAT